MNPGNGIETFFFGIGVPQHWTYFLLMNPGNGIETKKKAVKAIAYYRRISY